MIINKQLWIVYKVIFASLLLYFFIFFRVGRLGYSAGILINKNILKLVLVQLPVNINMESLHISFFLVSVVLMLANTNASLNIVCSRSS